MPPSDIAAAHILPRRGYAETRGLPLAPSAPHTPSRPASARVTREGLRAANRTRRRVGTLQRARRRETARGKTRGWSRELSEDSGCTRRGCTLYHGRGARVRKREAHATANESELSEVSGATGAGPRGAPTDSRASLSLSSPRERSFLFLSRPPPSLALAPFLSRSRSRSLLSLSLSGGRPASRFTSPVITTDRCHSTNRIDHFDPDASIPFWRFRT